MFPNPFLFTNQTTRPSAVMDEEDNDLEDTNSHKQYTFVSQKMVSVIEKSQSKMISFQKTYCDQRQNDLALIDREQSHIKESLSVFDLV